MLRENELYVKREKCRADEGVLYRAPDIMQVNSKLIIKALVVPIIA